MEEKKENGGGSSSTHVTDNGGINVQKKQKKWKRLLGQEEEEKRRSFRCGFHINDHPDVVVEVLSRLDARSLAAAACVCRLWSSLCRHDALWESLCHRHHLHQHQHPWSTSIRPVVAALGGYRRLYSSCVRPALARLRERDRRRLTLSLSLSLFSVQCYERLGGRGDAPSLWFLCHPPLNVS